MKPIIWGEEGESVDWKVFFLSLCTIFIAELGDKTQLAVFSLVSQSRTPLAVFLGASLGLALVTLIGVLFGGVLMRYIPPLYMRLAASFLFIGIGFYTLWKTCLELAK
jgi:putative Ca2+/H+ antiporter (TMEM165/GDT1 family)